MNLRELRHGHDFLNEKPAEHVQERLCGIARDLSEVTGGQGWADCLAASPSAIGQSRTQRPFFVTGGGLVAYYFAFSDLLRLARFSFRFKKAAMSPQIRKPNDVELA
jgi:hypothetical protein